MHESLLTSRSKFFKKAMNKGWKEAEDKLVKLPEDDPDIFALYEQLVYTGCIPVFDDDPERIYHEDGDGDSNGDDDSSEDDEKSNDGHTYCQNITVCQNEYNTLFKLYIFAEKIQDREAKKSCLDAINTKVEHESSKVDNFDTGPCLPAVPIIKMVYQNTPESSAARQSLVHCYAFARNWAVVENLPESSLADIPPVFLLDLAHSAITNREAP